MNPYAILVEVLLGLVLTVAAFFYGHSEGAKDQKVHDDIVIAARDTTIETMKFNEQTAAIAAQQRVAAAEHSADDRANQAEAKYENAVRNPASDPRIVSALNRGLWVHVDAADNSAAAPASGVRETGSSPGGPAVLARLDDATAQALVAITTRADARLQLAIDTLNSDRVTCNGGPP